MSYSETITKTDLTNILNELGTGVPYEDTGAKSLSHGISYRRKNGFVYVDCYCTSGLTVTTSYQVIDTLPEGYRPRDTLYVPLGINSSSVGVAYVNSSGNIGVKTYSGTTSMFWFHFSYPVTTNAYFDEKVDYIVEQGTDGFWTYRKWNSGIAECWGVEMKNSNVATAWGTGYLSPVLSTSFPSNLFNAAPTGVSIFITGAYTANAVNSGTRPTKDAVTYYLFRPSSGTTFVDYYAHIQAVGRWK